jgi:hypothetical protein
MNKAPWGNNFAGHAGRNRNRIKLQGPSILAAPSIFKPIHLRRMGAYIQKIVEESKNFFWPKTARFL